MRILTAVLAVSLAVRLQPLANAALVTTTLTFDTPTAAVNRLALTLLDGATTTDVSGTLIARLDMDTTTGVVTSLELDGGLVSTTDWSMTITGVGLTTGVGGVGTGDTTLPATLLAGNNFDATRHFVALTGGTVTPGAAPTVNLAGTDIEGFGTGTLTSTLNGGVFDIVFSMQINDDEEVVGQNLNISGTLTARGQVVAVPEPSSSLVLVGSLALGAFYRRRS